MLAEWCLYGLVGLGLLIALLAIPVSVGWINRKAALVAAVTVVAATGFIFLQAEQITSWEATDAASERSAIPRKREDHLFAGSTSCRACHVREYATWHQSFHRTMTQVATADTVIAPFDSRTLTRYGQESKVERRENEFWVNMVDPFWNLGFALKGKKPPAEGVPRAEFRIVMTTGSHSFQAYWYLADETRELWLFPWRYMIEDQAWIHVDDVFLQDPPDRPATGHHIWNQTCIGCHSVAGQPGLNSATGRFENTHVAELGISCEACHGPAQEHIRVNQDPLRRYSQHFAGGSGDPTIFNPGRSDQHLSTQACGACHSHFHFDPNLKANQDLLVSGHERRPGIDLLDRGRFMTGADETVMKDGETEITVSRFWADGACRSGGREHNGMIESGCYSRGKMTCLSCHSMHGSDPDDQLKPNMRTNLACLQCHQQFEEDISAHTHHVTGSSGSECVNCHMPYSSFALLRGIRSHRIDSPKVVPFAENARLNACNLCHLDQTQQWTASTLKAWFGTEESVLSDEDRTVAASLVWLLKGDGGQRVLSGWHFGWPTARHASGTEWMRPFLAVLLQDPYSAVRYSAWKALGQHQFLATDVFQEIREVLFEDPDGLRDRISEELLQNWVQEMSGKLQSELHTLPGGADGFSESAMRAMLQQRNDRPMVVVE